jgi:hypothetical protein
MLINIVNLVILIITMVKPTIAQLIMAKLVMLN